MKTPATATAIDSTDRSVQERAKTAVPRADKNFVNKRQNIGERMMCTHVTVGEIDRCSHTYIYIYTSQKTSRIICFLPMFVTAPLPTLLCMYTT